MVLERVPLSQLKGDPNNARQHNDKQISAIRTSLDDFDQVIPIVVGPDFTIIGGHGTVAAMLANGETEADVIVTEHTGPKATKLGLALNRLGELSKWDKSKLAARLQELDEADVSADELELDDLVKPLPDEGDLDLKEWSADDIVAHARFTVTGPLALQAKIRAVLVREFPGVHFDEEVIHE